jgi:class 3 adenylate cyclase/tetratricopeptide (TPR) repeat protein
VTCHQCGHQLPAGSTFCNGCGAMLDSTCASCGATPPRGSRFCNACGATLPAEPAKLPETARAALSKVAPPPQRDPRAYTPKHLADKILRSKSALEGERKQVTVLFADVKGSMELAEQVDPEEWYRIMDRFFQILAEGVHRFEGTVNQYAGDGIMALFGAPIANEDHAQRACYAALHLREELRRYAEELKRTKGHGFAVRMGINSGEVVVGTIGDDLRMDYTAQGHTVGLAARMEQLAGADRTYLTEHTAALVSGYFRLRDLGPFTVKGVRDPLRVYELEGTGSLRTKLDVSRARGFSRFVGREEETATLEAALARAAAGDGQVVGVVAEAGVGKSRLCYEFVQRCRARGIPVHEAHGAAHGKMVPYLLALEFLRGYFGIGEQDTAQAMREKIAGRLLLLDPALADALPLLLDFLGVPDPERPLPSLDPEVRQHRLFEAMRRLTHARSRREPGVTLIEDLHWIDGASEAFVAHLVEAVAGTRTLVVVTFRPEYDAAWMRRSYYQRLALPPLGPEAIAELLADRLGTDPSLAELGERIRTRTGGNPFFIEEIVQALVEAGSLAGTTGAYRLIRPVDELTIPRTVQAVLAGRIDRLPAREKEVLGIAAVIGREVPGPVLHRVAGLPETELAAAVAELVSREFLYETSLYPEAEYAFKHPLTQEMAYRSQLAERRKAVHAAVARAIEGFYADRLDQHAALLAQHWEGAGEALLAADWHRRAAEWVGARDRGEVSRHWQRVRTLLDAVPESSETLAMGVLARIRLVRNGLLLGQADDEAAALFGEGLALASRLDSPAPRIFLLGAYGTSRLMSGAVDEALAHLTESCRLADQSGNTFLQFTTRVALAPALQFAGQLREAVGQSDEAERLCGGDPELGAYPGFSPFGIVLTYRARTLAFLGRLGEAVATARRAIEIAHRRQDLESLVTGHQAGELACELAGDVEGALGHGRQAVEAAATASWAMRMIALATLGRAHLLVGAWLPAVEAMTGARAIMRERRLFLVLEGFDFPVLAEASLGAGDPGVARETADLALARTRQHHTRVYEITALLAWARVRLATDGAHGAAGIEAALRDAMALVEATEARAYAPFIHVERAALAHLLGDEITRQRELREAHRLFTEMGATVRAEQVAKDLAA